MMALSIKAGTMLLQLTGLSVSASYVGGGNMMRGMYEAYGKGGVSFTKPIETYNFIAGKSAFMATRLRNWSREVKDANRVLVSKRGGVVGSAAWLKRNAMMGIAFAQMFVDMPTWLGMYQAELAKNGGNDAKAVEAADRAVRLTQGSGKQADLARVQNGSELMKGITTFYSWFNTMLNLTMLKWNDAKRAETKAAGAYIMAHYFLFAWIGSAAMEILLDTMRDRVPDEDDEKKRRQYFVSKMVNFWSGMIPLVRNFADAVISGREIDFLQGTRGFSEWANTVNQAINIYDGKRNAEKKLAVSAIRSVGYATGAPLEWAAQVTKEVWDYMDGTDPELELRKLLLR
jgi:hypothetical protein